MAGTAVQHRRGTAAQWAVANPVLPDGEFGYEKDTGIVKMGNGVSTWNQLQPILIGSFLDINGKAYDADRLDGLDSTAYVKQNETVTAATPNAPVRRDGAGEILLPSGQALSAGAARRDFVVGIRRLLISRTLTASETLTLADEGGLIVFNAGAAVSLTIPTNAAVPFPIGGWFDVVTTTSTGPITITPAAGVTIRTPAAGYPIKCLDTYAPVRLLKIGTDEWMPIDGTIDTGWVNLTINSGFAAHATGAPQCRRVNQQVFYRGGFAFTGMAAAATFDVAIIPVGFRPPAGPPVMVPISTNSANAAARVTIDPAAATPGTFTIGTATNTVSQYMISAVTHLAA